MAVYSLATQRPVPGVNGGLQLPGPRRLVLHTTEGLTIASAMAAYRAKKVAPHFTLDLLTDEMVQHIDTSLSASALRNDPGGVQTNRLGRVIQIEIVGFASDTPNLPAKQLKTLGTRVRAICKREGIDPLRHPAFVGPDAGFIARPDAPQRFTPHQWETFSGVCGHQHVPENSHWDPGALPYERAMVLSAPAQPPTVEDDVKIMLFRRDSRNGRVYRVPLGGDSKTWVDADVLAIDNLNAASSGYDTDAIVDVTSANGHKWLDSYKTVT